jgi:hypothetical protein
MNVLDDRARGKLVKLCGRLESSHDGEVLAAAGQLRRFLREHKLSWDDVIGVKGVRSVSSPTSTSRQGDVQRVQQALRNTLFLTNGERQRLAVLAATLIHNAALSHEDEGFLADIYVRVGV